MNIRNLMSMPARVCTPETSVAAAAGQMWDGDCGMLPVVDDERRLLGVITDRDICMAVATRPQLASEITVGSVMTTNPSTCSPDDELADALNTMGKRHVRRLPVLDDNGELLGVVSMNDFALVAQRRPSTKSGVPSNDSVVSALKQICEHVSAQIVPSNGAATNGAATADEELVASPYGDFDFEE
jgi:CBS domain-containing protein